MYINIYMYLLYYLYLYVCMYVHPYNSKRFYTFICIYEYVFFFVFVCSLGGQRTFLYCKNSHSLQFWLLQQE